MSAAKCDNILTDTNVSDGEQEIDENDLLGEALPEESSARVRVRESPPDSLYDLMKQMQESMNSMASSMKTDITPSTTMRSLATRSRSEWDKDGY